MVAMFSWLCADPFILNCYRSGVSNSEYYLLFSSSSESISSNFSLSNNEVNIESFNTNNNNCEWPLLNLQEAIDSSKDITLNNNCLITCNSFVQSKKSKKKMLKAASEPPLEKCLHISSEKRKNLHQLFSFGIKKRINNKLTKNTIKEFRFQNFKNCLSKIDKILVCFLFFI